MSDDKKNIVLLVSYPKSGNTWLRIIIENLIINASEPVCINSLRKSQNASSRALFDEFSGSNSSDLSAKEIDRIRPFVYEGLSKTLKDDILFLKVHESWYRNSSGNDIYPTSIIKGVVYIARNPLDVAVSYAFHYGVSFDEAIEIMNNSEYSLGSSANKLHSQLFQKISSWSNHLVSWIDQSQQKTQIIRYEDLQIQPIETIKKVIDFLNLDYDDSQIRKALTFSSFDLLQQQEIDSPFKEKSLKSKSFFRNGKSGNFHEFLSMKQIDRICSDHLSIMKRCGYTT